MVVYTVEVLNGNSKLWAKPMRMDWNLYVENTHQNICRMAIVLKKGGDTHRINLDKKTGNALTGEIVINLDWNKGRF